MNKLLKYLMYVSVILICLIITGIFISQFWMFLVIELFQDVPLLIPMGIMFFVMIDTLTPNKKRFSALVGLALLEIMEHLIFPLVVLIGSILLNVFFILLLFPLVYLIFGKILGKIKEKKDRIRIGVLYLLTLFLLTFPYIVWKVNWFAPFDNAGFILLVSLNGVMSIGYLMWLYFNYEYKKGLIALPILVLLNIVFFKVFAP